MKRQGRIDGRMGASMGLAAFVFATAMAVNGQPAPRGGGGVNEPPTAPGPRGAENAPPPPSVGVTQGTAREIHVLRVEFVRSTADGMFEVLVDGNRVDGPAAQILLRMVREWRGEPFNGPRPAGAAGGGGMGDGDRPAVGGNRPMGDGVSGGGDGGTEGAAGGPPAGGGGGGGAAIGGGGRDERGGPPGAGEVDDSRTDRGGGRERAGGGGGSGWWARGRFAEAWEPPLSAEKIDQLLAVIADAEPEMHARLRQQQADDPKRFEEILAEQASWAGPLAYLRERDADEYGLRIEEHRIRRSLFDCQMRYSGLTGEDTSEAAEKVRAEAKAVLERYFDLEGRRQTRDLERLEAQISQLRQRFGERATKRDEIILQRLERLLNPTTLEIRTDSGLEGAPEPRRPGAGGGGGGR